MQEKSTNSATETLVLFYKTWINTFCKGNSRGAGVDGVENSFVAYLRLWDQADLGAKVGNALALRSHADPLWKIPRLTALLVEPAPNMVASQSHTGSCSLQAGAVHSGAIRGYNYAAKVGVPTQAGNRIRPKATSVMTRDFNQIYALFFGPPILDLSGTYLVNHYHHRVLSEE